MFSVNRRFPLFRKVVLALFALPLALSGGSFLGGLAQSQTIGSVGELEIPRNEFVGRYQSALEEYRRATGNENVSEDIANRIVGNVRSDLLSYYLMKAAIENKGVFAPDSAVAEEIRATPDFHDDDGEFSPALYNEFVSDRRYYQERVRESIGREQVFRAMLALPQEFIPAQLAAFRRQERIVDEAVFALSSLTTVTLNVPADDINLYYQRNSSRYRLREEASFEYFIFSLEEFAADVTVSAAAVQAAYDDYLAEQADAARRRVSHIYIEDETLAEELAARAMAAPEEFAALAAEHSEDAFSAEEGGALGIVAIGDLPPALDAVAFTMSAGQVHAPVETEEGGFSILKLDELIARDVPPLADIRPEMTARARRAAAEDDFLAQVEDLRELAPIEIGSLEAMAAAAGAAVQTLSVVYNEAADNPYPFNDDAVLPDVFDPLVTADGENSAPIPLDDGAYLFARAARYQAPGLQPLEEVSGSIHEILRAGYTAIDLERQLDRLYSPQTLTAAVEDESEGGLGEAAVDIAELLETVEWRQAHTVALASNDDEDLLNDAAGGAGDVAGDDSEEGALDNVTIDRIFAANLTHGLPAYVFAPQEGEIRLFRIRDIIDSEAAAQDYLVVNELIDDMTARLTGVGYLDQLSADYNYEFYNVPDVIAGQQ